MTDRLTLAQARALWWQKQGLGAKALAGSLAARIGGTGWLRTLGGADVYLAARARAPDMTRAELDAIVERGELRVVPAARGCIYLVPARAVGDLMAWNVAAWRATTERDLGKIGSTIAVVERLASAVLGALTGPMTTDALRRALPAGAIPSFGDAGKKVGLSSPLPLVLRLLEFDGRIERTLDGGKLDSERYLWRKAQWQTPRSKGDPTDAMIGAFLDFAGPVTLGQLSKWSGIPQRDVRANLDRLGAVAVTIESMGEAWGRAGDAAAAKQAPPPSGTALLAFEDNFLVNHGGLAAVSDPRHHSFKSDVWGGSKPEAIGDADHVLSRTIVIDGLIVGFWEVDPRTQGAVWMTFDPAPKPLAAKLDELTAEAARFLLDQIGTARVFTLDTMDEVQVRADRIVKLRGGGKPKAIASKVVKKPAPKPRNKKPAPKNKPAPKKRR